MSWPASLVELSLLFLYGEKPNVTEANVDTLLDIAEFMLVPELKVACIDFLKQATVTINNCMQFLELSCVYGFGLDTCVSFILSELPDVLNQGGMLNATTESVKMLLKDPTLSYVPVQNWFNFLIRWTKQYSERQCHFVELFHMLNFGECDSEFINSIVTKESLVMKNEEELKETLKSGQTDTVLIFQNRLNTSLKCLNLRRMLWYKIDITIGNDNEESGQFRNTPISGVKNGISSSIYKAIKTHDSFRVLTHDLSNAESSVSNVVISGVDNGAKRCNFDHYSFANDTLVAISNTTQRKFTRAGKSGRAFTHLLHSTPTLYIGRLIGTDWEMHAIMTIRNNTIMQICCGDNGSIAMLSSDRDNLFIFNEPTAELDCIQLKTNFKIEISLGMHLARSSGNNFVLHDNCSVVCISRLSGASLKTKYLVKQLTWKKPYKLHVKLKHVFDGDRWFRFRYIRKLYQYGSDEASLVYISHDDLTSIEDMAFLPWKTLPLPSEAEQVYRACQDVFAVSLSKGGTRCHLDCPNCKMHYRPQSYRIYLHDHESDKNYDSSDEDDWSRLTRIGRSRAAQQYVYDA